LFSALVFGPEGLNGGAGRGDYLLLLGGCGDERATGKARYIEQWSLDFTEELRAKLTLEGKCPQP
jgi:hypothetical protein